MLVISRERDEEIVIGTADMVHISLSQEDRTALARCQDPLVKAILLKILAEPQGLLSVEVVDIRGDKVRLGIKAARNIPVHRREVYDAIERKAKAQNRRNVIHAIPVYEQRSAKAAKATKDGQADSSKA